MASTAPRRRKMSPAMIMQVLYPVALESKPASQIVPVEREKPSADFTCEPHATTGIAEPRPTVEDGGLVVRRGFSDAIEGGSSSLDLGDDVVDGLGPHERLRVVVPV